MVRRVLIAESTEHLGSHPALRGVLLLESEELPGADPRPAAPGKELAAALASLASLMEAGAPLVTALQATASASRQPTRELLEGTSHELVRGKSLAAALTSQGLSIPRITAGIIAAAEQGGDLESGLREAAQQLEDDIAVRSRLRAALAYPTILMLAGVGSMLVIGGVVLPRFAVLLNDVGQELPASTRILLGVASGLHAHWPMVVLALAIGSWAVVGYTRSTGGRRALHECLWRLPVVGPIRQGFATARFTRAMAAMLGSATPLLEALRLSVDHVGDDAMALRVRRAAERVAEGMGITRALEEQQALPAPALALVGVGEAGGQLVPMLARAGAASAGDAQRKLESLVGYVEPAIILCFGGGVALMALALFQAVYAIRPA